MNNTEKYQFKFMLDWGCNCLWGNDTNTQREFGYPINDSNFDKLGLSEKTIKLNNLISELYDMQVDFSVNHRPIPLLWSGKMYKFYQKKLKELYENVCLDLQESSNIILGEQELREIEEIIDEKEKDQIVTKVLNGDWIFDIKPFLNLSQEGLLEEAIKEYSKWKEKENKYLEIKTDENLLNFYNGR